LVLGKDSKLDPGMLGLMRCFAERWQDGAWRLADEEAEIMKDFCGPRKAHEVTKEDR